MNHTAENNRTATWHALLTHAQHGSGLLLPREIEVHLVSLLMHYLGQAEVSGDFDKGLLNKLEQMMASDSNDPAVVGDQCLLFAGLFSEHAIRKRVPVSYFVEVGRNAYREFASKHELPLYAMLAESFVPAMDTLQTLRQMYNNTPCLDGFNAFYLWHELGSASAWRTLRQMTPALPASCSTSHAIH